MERLRSIASSVLIAVVLIGSSTIASGAVAAQEAVVVDVTQAPYSAVGNGTTNDRAAIQRAIDDVAAAGGGTVVVPAARRFLTGSVVLRSNVMLQLDGTLVQSQNLAHYDPADQPVKGHLYPGGMSWWQGDLAALHNTPLVHAANATNVGVVGAGGVELTRATGGTVQQNEDATIHVAAIGFYRVTQFQVRNVDLIGASSYSLALYTTNNGTVQGVTIVSTNQDANPNGGSNTDGISIQNSQDIRVTGNSVRSGDDGIYVWASYRDRRGNLDGDSRSWWSSDTPQPSRRIEIDNNSVLVDRHNNTLCCGGVALIAWGGGGTPTGGNAPDQRQVEISDIHIHDNRLEAGYPLRCWCGGGSETQSPIKRVTMLDNTLIPGFHTPENPTGPNLTGKITNYSTDLYQYLRVFSARNIRNGSFETTGEAWWTPTGTARVIGQSDTAGLSTAARAALVAAGGWVGYLGSSASGPATVIQSFLPLAPEDFSVTLPSVRQTIAASVVTDGNPVRLAVRSRCTGAPVVKEVVVAPTTWTRYSLTFDVASHSCGGFQIGLESTTTAGTWAMIDSVTSETHAIDDADARVVKSGTWWTYDSTTSIRGSHIVGTAAGSNVKVTFNGSRAVLYGIKDTNLGKADVYIDGVRRATIDYYASSRTNRVIVFDSGALTAGTHTFELRTLGTKNASSTGIYTVYDALFT